MTFIEHVTIEAADVEAAARFHDALGLGERVRLRASEEPTSGFRGFTLSLTASQPGNVRALFDAGIAAGGTVIKPVAKSLWGVGGTLRAPDGTIWKIATSGRKDSAPAAKEFDSVVLLLGVDDVAATKRYYVDCGLTVDKSFGSKYVQFAGGQGAVTLGLYKRKALAKDAGVPAEGSGSHRITVGSAAGPFTDPDGFLWEDTARTPAP
ncbi:glyoxalase [Actinocorallia longicatena]|uniref:Glyoxalase n=1 Tax=Actinocorallia longicatena TaxID=111803 RepID=A0ABP6QD97_9ACTN